MKYSIDVTNFQNYKDYGSFYTYFSKRGYFVAVNRFGNYAGNGNIEATGETEAIAIVKLKHEVIHRMDKIKTYYESKLNENEEILNQINNIKF